MADKFIDIGQGLKTGLRALNDSVDEPVGSSRVAQNILISDRGGISKRPGSSILGSLNTSNYGCRGFYVFRKPFTKIEIPVKTYSTFSEYYHPDLLSWQRLESGFTSGEEFGFREFIRSVDNEDYLHMGNRTEAHRRWQGAYTQTNGALSGGETTVNVDRVLKPGVFYSGTASANSATTVDIASAAWAASQWINFYIYITAGTHAGKIRKITANTTTQLTFDTLGSGPGNVAFEIRLPAFPASGTLVIGTEEVAYSAIPTATSFTTSAIVSAHADNSAVTVKPTAYPGLPKGNRFEVNYDRLLIGNVRSAISLDSSGNQQGSQSTGSIYVSKLRDATTFVPANPRAAGDGDIISFPEGNGDCQDIANQEESFYAFFPNCITAVKYSTDANDVAIKTPIKTGVGSVGRVIKGDNDIYFVTGDKKLSSVGRQLQKDSLPQIENMGLSIKRITDDFDFTNHNGKSFKQRVFHSCKVTSADAYNNRVIVYNEQNKAYDGIWNLPVHGFEIYGQDMYFADSRTPNVYKMFDGVNDYDGVNRFAVNSIWKSNWLNLTSSKANLQSVYAQFVTGYIWGGTNITFEIYKGFSDNATLSFTFGADEDEFMLAQNLGAFFGSNPLGLSPLGTISGVQSDGSRRFHFVVFFPFIYDNYFSVGITENSLNGKFDVTDIGLALSEDPAQNTNLIKTIN